MTGLPWSFDVQTEIGRWTEGHQVHAILAWLSGLEGLNDAYGPRVAQTCLRHIAGRITRRLDARDRLTRHFASGLLLFTIRPPGEIPTLRAGISRDVSGAALDVRGTRLPHAYISHASAGPGSDPVGAIRSFDVLIMSLEAAAINAARAPGTPVGGGGAGAGPSGARVVLEHVNVEIVKGATSVSCTLAMGDRHASATSVGRNGEATRLALVADAAAQAVTKLLPTGHGLSVRSIRPTGDEAVEGVWVAVDYVAPAERGVLQGVAPVRSDRYSAIARAVLSAVNRYVAHTR